MSQDKKIDNTLVVLGATGNQGNAVLLYFAEHHNAQNYNLRGVTRNTESEKSNELKRIGVEMVKADLDDISSLKQAFSGATHIFATTDSNQLIFDAIRRPEVLKNGQNPRSYAREIELTQGENIATAAASTTTLQRIVWSSLPSPKIWSNGKYSKVTMFDTKEEIANLLAKKEELQDKLSVVLIGFYATNALAVPHLYGPQKQSDGTYELALPMSGDVEVPIADLESDLGAWVLGLFQASPGITLLGSTEVLSWKQWLSMWAKHNRVTARYRRATESEYASKIEGISEAVLEEFAYIEEFGFTGSMPDVVRVEDLRGQGIELPTSSIAAHIERTDWSSIL